MSGSLRRLLSRGVARPSGDRRPPPSGAPPGARRLEQGFFDAHPRFLHTSETSARPWRLNLRHEAIFAERDGLFHDATVLDIASHDGRWSLAALEAGARHVTGVEARPELVAHAVENLRGAGVDDGRYEFRTGSVFDVLADPVDADVVLCLGFFYHTLRYPELWSRMRGCRPAHIVIDTLVDTGRRPVIRVADEQVDREGNAVADEFSADDRVLTGRPTVAAVRRMAKAYGYTLAHRADWPALLRDNPDADGIGDYREGRRATLFFEQAAS